MDIEVLSKRGATASDAEAKSLRLRFERAVWTYICICGEAPEDDDPVLEEANEDLKAITQAIATLPGNSIETLRAKATSAYFWSVADDEEDLQSDRADESGLRLDRKTSADLMLAIAPAFCATFRERYLRYLNSPANSGRSLKIARGYLASAQEKIACPQLAVSQ